LHFSVALQIKGNILNEQDARCCGSGVCIINHAGECWCGQVWNGKEMVAPSLNTDSNTDQAVATDPDSPLIKSESSHKE
jgi:hypothetical protein